MRRARPVSPSTRFLVVATGVLAGLFSPPGLSDSALVAVATNFATAAAKLRGEFEELNSHNLTLVTGSTGKLYAQIRSGAPFDVLLAADRERPARLVADGLAVPGSGFTYALGRLTLWSADPARVTTDGKSALGTNDFRLAMANPDLAPYGTAAAQVLTNLGLGATLRDRIVLGENVGQAHAMVATGNAELGLLARSYVVNPRNRTGSYWHVPEHLHKPIFQDAVLLTRARHNKAAREFLVFLRSESARAAITALGYSVN